MRKINFPLAKIGAALLIISLILIVLFFLIQKDIKPLDKSRVALIDKVGNNYIFRGNNPFVIKNGKTVFAYEELTSYFNEILQNEGHLPLDGYYLIDVSLLDFDQYYAIKKEEDFFALNSQEGKVINFSTLSTSLLFGKFSNFGIVNKSVNNYNLWITDRLNKIHDLLSKQTDKQIVVYLHCDSGRDRTGLMTTSYRLLFDNLQLKTIRELDLKEVRRSSVFTYDQAIRSYCAYVRKTFNKPNDYCAYIPSAANK